MRDVREHILILSTWSSHGRKIAMMPLQECFIIIYYIHGNPFQGPPFEGGMYHLPSVVLNTFKDMLRKHSKFQCFMHILLVLF